MDQAARDDEALRASLLGRLDQELTARERVRLEWALTKVSTRVIQRVVSERFALFYDQAPQVDSKPKEPSA